MSNSDLDLIQIRQKQETWPLGIYLFLTCSFSFLTNFFPSPFPASVRSFFSSGGGVSRGRSLRGRAQVEPQLGKMGGVEKEG